MIKKAIIGLLAIVLLSLFGWKMKSGTVNLPATTAISSVLQSITPHQQHDTPPLIFTLTGSKNNPCDQKEVQVSRTIERVLMEVLNCKDRV